MTMALRTISEPKMVLTIAIISELVSNGSYASCFVGPVRGIEPASSLGLIKRESACHNYCRGLYPRSI